MPSPMLYLLLSVRQVMTAIGFHLQAKLSALAARLSKQFSRMSRIKSGNGSRRAARYIQEFGKGNNTRSRAARARRRSRPTIIFINMQKLKIALLCARGVQVRAFKRSLLLAFMLTSPDPRSNHRPRPLRLPR